MVSFTRLEHAVRCTRDAGENLLCRPYTAARDLTLSYRHAEHGLLPVCFCDTGNVCVRDIYGNACLWTTVSR